jgi:hypothetical protein
MPATVGCLSLVVTVVPHAEGEQGLLQPQHAARSLGAGAYHQLK